MLFILVHRARFVRDFEMTPGGTLEDACWTADCIQQTAPAIDRPGRASNAQSVFQELRLVTGGGHGSRLDAGFHLRERVEFAGLLKHASAGSPTGLPLKVI